MDTLPIHLDRLIQALENAGIRVKRNKAIEIAAAAFGFRASNALVAAAKAGTLPPPAEPPPPREPWLAGSGPWTAKDDLVLGEQARPSVFDADGNCMGATASNEYLDPTEDYVDPVSWARGQLFAAAPTLRNALEDLLDWERAMGGFDSPAWQRAREAISELRRVSAPPTDDKDDDDDEDEGSALDEADDLVEEMTRDELLQELEDMGEGDVEDEDTDTLKTILVGCLRQDGDAAAFVRERKAKLAQDGRKQAADEDKASQASASAARPEEAVVAKTDIGIEGIEPG